jgi:predicted nucleotidyltransferase
MPALAETTLSDVERRVLDRLLPRLEETVALRAVWLFGSRARGEEPRDADSDVDLLVVTTGGRADVERVRALVHEVATGRFYAQLHARAHASEKPRMAVTYEGLFVGAEGAEAFLDTAERFVAAVESLLGLPDHA